MINYFAHKSAIWAVLSRAGSSLLQATPAGEVWGGLMDSPPGLFTPMGSQLMLADGGESSWSYRPMAYILSLWLCRGAAWASSRRGSQIVRASVPRHRRWSFHSLKALAWKWAQLHFCCVLLVSSLSLSSLKGRKIDSSSWMERMSKNLQPSLIYYR